MVMLNFSLTKKQLELQEKARAFALETVLPQAWYYDAREDTPVHILKKAFDAGLSNGDILKSTGERDSE